MKLLALTLIATLSADAAFATPNPKCATAIGSVLLEQARHAPNRRPDLVIHVIQKEYDSIKTLPVAERVEFFWLLSLTVNLDASYLSQFRELIIKDCLDQYLARARKFIQDAGGDPDAPIRTIKDFSGYQTELNPLGRAIIHHGSLKQVKEAMR